MIPATQRVYIHVGLPKTGTTSVQELMWHHRDALAERGLLYPGDEPVAQHRAVMDVHSGRYRQWDEPGIAGSWEWLVERLRSWQGDAVFSTELLAPASPDEAAQVLDALRFAEIHIVCTARDFARQVPSVWQENVKTRHTTSYADLLESLRAADLDDISRLFWDYQDLPRVLRTWGGALPPERVHVVTVPRRGSSTGVLWDRFASVLGLDTTGLSTAIGLHNFSLGTAETELLRRLNERVVDEIDWPRYASFVKEHLAERVLARRSGGARPQLPPEAHDWACHTARRFVDEIGAAGYHVVGDLDELIPEPPASEQPDASSPEAQMPDDAALLDLALEVLADLARRPHPAP
ncbi:hypothetical protein, partial [Saccharomonospora saliphila]|uniref:hypothetical protein n=1 Tax=Saccharomonospora saliphila TaxID=369829 RepID=UPI0003757F55